MSSGRRRFAAAACGAAGCRGRAARLVGRRGALIHAMVAMVLGFRSRLREPPAPLTLPGGLGLESRCAGRHAQRRTRAPAVPPEPCGDLAPRPRRGPRLRRALNARRGEWDSDRLHDVGAAVDVWARWDSDWFLRIAENGYSWPSSTPAFFPLYPLLVAGRLGAPRRARRPRRASSSRSPRARPRSRCSTGSRLLRLGEDEARRTVLFLAVAPTSLFFGAVYSESLFLLLAVAAFLLAERGRFWGAGAPPASRSSPGRPGSRSSPRWSCSRGGRPTGAARLRASPSRRFCSLLYPLAARRLDRPPARVSRRAEGRLGAAALARRAARRGRRRGAAPRAARPRRRRRARRPRGGRVAAHRGRVRALRARERRAAACRSSRTRCRSGRCSVSPSSSSPPSWRSRPSCAAAAARARTATILAAWLAVYVVRWALWYWVA